MMRHAPLLFCLLLGACATTEAPAPEVRNIEVPAAPAPGPDDDHGIEGPIPDEPSTPRFELLGSRVDSGALRITGKVYDTHIPAALRLRHDLGCAREVTLQTTSTGIAFSTALGADDLATALGCAVHVEAGDELSAIVAVTPEARVTTATGGLTLDGDVALVAADLDPRAGDRVRITVLSPEPLTSATAKLGGATYAARLVDDDAHAAIFELPARDWAKAIVTATHLVIDARREHGSSASMVVAPHAVATDMRDDD